MRFSITQIRTWWNWRGKLSLTIKEIQFNKIKTTRETEGGQTIHTNQMDILSTVHNDRLITQITLFKIMFSTMNLRPKMSLCIVIWTSFLMISSLLKCARNWLTFGSLWESIFIWSEGLNYRQMVLHALMGEQWLLRILKLWMLIRSDNSWKKGNNLLFVFRATNQAC